MPGPWEDYAQSGDGPWSDYGKRKPAKKSNTGVKVVDRANDKSAARYEAGKERSQAARANPAKPGSRIIPDALAPAQNAFAAIGEGYNRFANANADNGLGAMGREQDEGVRQSLGGVAGLVMSPISGPINALSGMAARGAEQLGLGNEDDNREIINNALMGARAAPGVSAATRAAPAARVQPSRAASEIAKRGKVDVPATRARVADARAAGVEPNLTGVVGERGQRVIRAVGAKNPTAGEALTNRARTSAATTKPAVMDRTRHLVDDSRTAEKYMDDLIQARDEAARTNYAEPYALEINITPETARALSGPSGEAAIDRAIQAAATAQDYHLLGELRRLKAATRMDVLPGQTKQTGYNTMTAAEPPLAPVSGAALDRVQIAMRKTAEGLDKTDQGDIARGLWKRRAQVNQELDNFEGLAEARADYRNKSQAIGVMDKEGRDFLTTAPADYQAWLQTLGPEARQANQVAIRQQIVDRLGRQQPNSYGAIEEMVSSQYGQQNLRAALGTEGEGYIANARAMLGQTRADQMVAPGAGSRTAVLEGDMQGIANAAGTVRKGLAGDWYGVATDWLRSRGIRDDVAQQIADRASDPAQLDRLLDEIEAALGPADAYVFMRSLSRPEVLVPAIEGSQATQQPSR